MQCLENAVNHIIPAYNINDMHKIALLNSMGKRASLEGKIRQEEYQRYVYFVLRTYLEIGARPQEMLMYLDELHKKLHDATLEKYIRNISRRKRAQAPPSQSEPPEEYLLESTNGVSPSPQRRRRSCGGWFSLE